MAARPGVSLSSIIQTDSGLTLVQIAAGLYKQAGSSYRQRLWADLRQRHLPTESNFPHNGLRRGLRF